MLARITLGGFRPCARRAQAGVATKLRLKVGDIGTHWVNVRVSLGLYSDDGEEHGNYDLV